MYKEHLANLGVQVLIGLQGLKVNEDSLDVMVAQDHQETLDLQDHQDSLAFQGKPDIRLDSVPFSQWNRKKLFSTVCIYIDIDHLTTHKKHFSSSYISLSYFFLCCIDVVILQVPFLMCNSMSMMKVALFILTLGRPWQSRPTW